MNHTMSLLLLLSTLLCATVSQAQWAAAATLTKQERYQQMLDAEVETRVVGGTQVTSTSKYPFFMEWEDAKCGASLIHDDIALSAAHCENAGHPFDTRVFLLGLETETGLSRFVERTMAHPLYSGQLQDYDILLLKLSESALVDSNGAATGAGTVALNRKSSVPAVGDALIGMGYGKESENAQDTSQYFNEVEIYYVDDATCKEQYGTDFLANLMFCAGVPGGGKDTCQGDSGGPVIDQKTNTQVGVVSFGIGCAQADYAGVNARVSSVAEWIDDQICELSDFPPARCNANNALTATTQPPDVLPSGGVGQLTVHIDYDDYPEETAWSLTYLDMADGDPLQLFLHPFAQDASIPDRASRSETFADLPAGTYSLKFGDQAGDGLCCAYGPGNMYVTNDLTGTKIWENNGKYGAYLEVLLEINAAGAVVVLEEDDEYDNSWEAFTAVNHPPTFDGQWPGAVPAAATNAVTINVKFDAFPEENDWTFFEQVNGAWSPLQTCGTACGTTSGVHNTLLSTEVSNLSPNWYRFSITDTQGDGVCCLYRRGWVSVTAPLVTNQQKGLAWGNNGEFGSGVDVYLQMDAQGYVSQVAYTDPLATGRSGGSLRKSEPGTRRQLELSAWTDLPKQQIKHRPSR